VTVLPDLPDALTNAKSGDSVAFATLVRTHQRLVFSMILRMVSNRHSAEDLAQETFLQLHRNLVSIETADHLVFWLRQVAMRKSIDYLRCQPRNEVELSEAAHCQDEAADRDPLLGPQLLKLFDHLTYDARAVMLLRYQDDLDPTEIARVLSMSINTVKSHLKRSLAFLRTRTLGRDHSDSVVLIDRGRVSL
jgi:RNA polymerase sigma-70 factor, ECF subfamily